MFTMLPRCFCFDWKLLYNEIQLKRNAVHCTFVGAIFLNPSYLLWQLASRQQSSMTHFFVEYVKMLFSWPTVLYRNAGFTELFSFLIFFIHEADCSIKWHSNHCMGEENFPNLIPFFRLEWVQPVQRVCKICDLPSVLPRFLFPNAFCWFWKDYSRRLTR